MPVFHLRIVEITRAGAVRVAREGYPDPFVLPREKGGIIWRGEVRPGECLNVDVPMWLTRKLPQLIGESRYEILKRREAAKEARVKAINDAYAAQAQREREERERSLLYCGFCGKNQHEVFRLIAGPTLFICDECVALCADIIEEGKEADRRRAEIEALGLRPLEYLSY